MPYMSMGLKEGEAMISYKPLWKLLIDNDKKKVDYFINKNPSTLIVIPFWEFKRIYSILDSIENLEELKEKFNITIIQSNKIIKELKQPNN